MMGREKGAISRARRLVRATAVIAVVGFATIAVVVASSAGDAPPPSPGAPSAGAPPTLPRLFAKESIVRVRGKILESTRGRKGPVRLELERGDGQRLSALVAPDERCAELGLSLKPGEDVELEGSLFQGRNPILAVTAVIVDGRPIQVRDQRGAPARPGASAGAKPPPAR